MMYTGKGFDFRALTSGFLRSVLREVYTKVLGNPDVKSTAHQSDVALVVRLWPELERCWLGRVSKPRELS